MTITIRRATLADLPALLELYLQLHPDDPRPPAETARRVWARMEAQEGRTVLVAVADGPADGTPGEEVVAGTADCTVMANLTRGGRPYLLVENVVVDRAFRRRGVGRRLMAAAADLGRAAGCYKVQLTAADTEEAHAFYEACGFRHRSRSYKLYLDSDRG
ncbi:GNAT family N-acetyltransferase [Thermostaphylospora chromogena]|uniref:Ribosomal protein S18 acetylase RimI n=1 Tax=Thermostaphylospora chromogena TaxID=35622 RepID=A0A1H1GQN2_9ACTN|nr:GNAT family N-acetyltransferase [Thermostaphylospora chromogena]SDR15459.1 Ribosomal protein S18 acetylase RimI [Thermostaphylospora chromogena]